MSHVIKDDEVPLQNTKIPVRGLKPQWDTGQQLHPIVVTSKHQNPREGIKTPYIQGASLGS